MHTGIVIATMLEAEPFIAGFQMELTAREPFPVYVAGDISLVISGIGKVNAALAAAHLVREKNITLLHNAGSAGALREGISTGSIYHINEIIDWDRPRLKDRSARSIIPHRLEGFSEASLATLDRPVITRSERELVGRAAELVDMEGAGFIQACRTHKVKGCLWKIVSDTAEHQKESEIIANIKQVAGGLFQFMEQRVLNIR